MHNYALSIIIPNYNSGRQIVSTLKSYEGNISSYSNLIEFVIVDDNSTDDSYDVLLNYSKNATFKVNLLKNGSNQGPGPSRNKAIEASSSSYITFMDADDSLSNDFFEKVIPIIQAAIYDCILFNFYIIDGHKRKKKNQFLCKILRGKSDEIITYCKGAPWGKIFKKSIIIENNIVFLNQMQAEDVGFVKVALSYCESFCLLNDYLYNYFLIDKSLMHTKNYINPNNHLNAFLYIRDNINKKHISLLEAIYSIDVLYDVGKMCSIIQNCSTWTNMIDEIMSRYPCCFNNTYIKRLPLLRRLMITLIAHKRYKIVKFLSSI